MRRKLANLFLGLVFIVIGACYVLNMTVWDNSSYSIFFDGWWTLFIIVPCIYSMIDNSINFGNVIGVLIGVALFIQVQDFWDVDFDLWKFTAPALLIVIGLAIIFGGRKKHYTYTKESCSCCGDNNTSTTPPPHVEGKIPCISAVFGGNTPNYDGQVFTGAKITCIFGGVDLKLRNAVIDHDCFIDATTIFGGCDILLPSNVAVKVIGTPFLGGIDNKFTSCTAVGAPVVTVSANCIFGGIDIK